MGTDIQKLLNDLKDIVERNNKRQEELSKRGDLFNVFSALRLDTDEVKHSAFLATLLNPYENHGQRDTFLKLFFNQIVLDKELNTIGANVSIEKDIGLKHNDNTEGGRIDILIEGPNKSYGIAIENKIYARDQEKQVSRYSNFLKNAGYPYSKVLYLTLDGHAPSPGSIDDCKENDYYCISYKDDIRNWLDKCILVSAQQPAVRESIKQYIHLINKLTNQEGDIIMSEEFRELLLKDENLEIIEKLANEIQPLKRDVLVNYIELIKEEFKERKIIITDYDNNLKSAVNSYISANGEMDSVKNSNKI